MRNYFSKGGFSLDKAALRKLAYGAAVVGAGAALTYASEHVGDVNFGVWQPVVSSLLSLAVMAFDQFVRPNATRGDK